MTAHRTRGFHGLAGDRKKHIPDAYIIITYLTLIVAFCCYPALAEETELYHRTDGHILNNAPVATPHFLTSAHQSISENVIQMGDRLDTFFGNQRIFEANRESLLKISTVLEAGEDKDTSLKLRASLRYILPNAENRFSLFLGREPPTENSSDRNLTESNLTPRLADNDDASYTGSLRYILPEWKYWDSDFDIGMKIRTDPIWYTKFKIQRIYDWDPWALRMTNKVFWLDDDGVGNTLRFDFERNLGHDIFFRASTTGTWLHDENGMQYDEVLTLIKNGIHKQATALQAIIVGKTRPENEIVEYTLRLKYRRQLKPKWLFLELRPEVAFPEARNYRSTWRIKIEIEALFGDEVFWK